MNIALEVIMVISILCAPPGKSNKEVQQSIKCNNQIISCVENTYKRQFIKNQVAAFNECYLKYETGQ